MPGNVRGAVDALRRVVARPGCAQTAGQVLPGRLAPHGVWQPVLELVQAQVEKGLPGPRWEGPDLPFSFPSPPVLWLLGRTLPGPGRQHTPSARKPGAEVP